MTLLALSMSSAYLVGEKSQLEAEEMGYVNDYNDITDEMSGYLEDSNNSAEDNTYRQLQSEQQRYDSKKGSVESRLKIINAEIEGFQEAVKNNVKTECKLSISV